MKHGDVTMKSNDSRLAWVPESTRRSHSLSRINPAEVIMFPVPVPVNIINKLWAHELRVSESQLLILLTLIPGVVFVMLSLVEYLL